VTIKDVCLPLLAICLGVSDFAQIIAAVATLVLAGMTFCSVRWQGKLLRLTQLPCLSPVRGAHRLLPQGADPGTEREWLRVQNLGPGTAFAVQWELVRELSLGKECKIVPFTATYLQQLKAGDVDFLWHVTGSGEVVNVEAETRLSIWFDDSLGNHYYSRFKPHGTGPEWIQQKQTWIRKRPAMFGKSVF